MLEDLFNGLGLGVLFLIALVLVVITIGFKVLLWVGGIIIACVLGYAIIKAIWFWTCRLMAYILPKGSRTQVWFDRQNMKY